MAETDPGGYLAAYAWVKQDPDMARLFDLAVAEKWTAEKFQAEIQATNWWKNHQATDRQWTALKASDPAQAQYLADQKYSELWAMADELGVRVTDEWLKGWTDLALRFGWSEQQARRTIAEAWQMWQYADTGGVAGQKNLMGAGGGVVMQLNALAGDYGVPLDDATKQVWARQILGGTASVDSFRAYLADVAMADAGWMKEGLSQGFTVKQLMAPYLSRAAQELGISPDEIDLSDPKWRQLLEVTDEAGQRVRPDTRSILNIIRHDQRFGFDNTDAALNAATDLNRGLLQMFGAI